jgi:hypothetical protein
MEDILEALNETGHNQGMYFSPRLPCGKQQEMERSLTKSCRRVWGAAANAQYPTDVPTWLGGCSRNEFVY